MAQNLHKNAIRDRSNRRRLLEEQASFAPGAAEGQASPGNGFEAREIREHVLALPEGQREVLTLICIEGYSYKECADLLNLPPTTVTNRLFQARMRLRRAMEAEAPHNDTPKRSASA